MIGRALGAAEGMALPHVFPGFWAMPGLAAVAGGVMRSPLTGVIFTLELTHAWPAILPLLISSASACALSALMLKRSVLTEKIARRGLHLTREYSTDPPETFFVSDAVTQPPVTVPGHETITRKLLASLTARLAEAPGQYLIPATAAEAARPCRLSVSTGQTLRQVAYLFAETGLTSAPATDPATREVTGVITLPHLLHARLHDLTEEHHRQRLIPRSPVTAPAPPRPPRPVGRPRNREPTPKRQRRAGERRPGDIAS